MDTVGVHYGRSSRRAFPHRRRPRPLSPISLLFILLLLLPAAALAQGGAISGTVRDAATGTGLAAVEIAVRDAAGTTVTGGFTSQNGTFRITNVPPGTYTVRFTIAGWRTYDEPGVLVTQGQVTSLLIDMAEQLFSMNPITATVARGVQEKLLEAPASVHVVDQTTIETRQVTSTTDYIEDVAGVDVITTGVQGNYFVARGFNNIFSGAVMFLTDYRIGRVPSLRANISHLNPTVPADIGRIEVVLGPGSAVYGPNTANGIVHQITTSPIDNPGVFFTAAGGTRHQSGSGAGPATVDSNTKGLFQFVGRLAGKTSEKFGVKVSGQYLGGQDFYFIDPVEVEQQQLAQACLAGVQDACLAFQPGTTEEQLENVGQRNFDVGNWSIDFRSDWRPNENTDVIFSYGHTNSVDAIDLTGIGAGQVVDWSYDYWQLRVNHKGLFGQFYFNQNDAGDTYLLRSGQPVVEKSFLMVGQLQNTSYLGERQSFTYGADVLYTNPRTEGTVTGVFEEEDQITDVGGFIQSQTQLSQQFDLTLALRADYNSATTEVAWSPRFALVYSPEQNQSIRATFNRAFSTPTVNNLSLDLLARIVPLLPGTPLAYPIQTQGVKNGFMFSRTDGRADIKSPFALLAGMSPASFLPNSTPTLWSLAVATITAQNPQLGAILGQLPAPDESQVGLINAFPPVGTRDFVVDPRGVDGVEDIPAIRNQITNTFEAGYKGLFDGRFLLGVDFYYTIIEDFIGPLRIETPNSFLGSCSAIDDFAQCGLQRAGQIGAYLASFGILPPELVAQVAATMAGLPLGVVTPEGVTVAEAPYLLTYRNFGNINLFGADIAAEFQPTPEWYVSLTASFVSDDTFDAGGLPVALNAPKFKTALGGGYMALDSGFMGELKWRYIDSFPAASGEYEGIVESYAPLDLMAGWRFRPGVSLQLSISNLLDESYQSFPGTPFLGRMFLARVGYATP